MYQDIYNHNWYRSTLVLTWLAAWQHQTITWTNDDLLLIGQWETHFSAILIEVPPFYSNLFIWTQILRSVDNLFRPQCINVLWGFLLIWHYTKASVVKFAYVKKDPTLNANRVHNVQHISLSLSSSICNGMHYLRCPDATELMILQFILAPILPGCCPSISGNLGSLLRVFFLRRSIHENHVGSTYWLEHIAHDLIVYKFVNGVFIYKQITPAHSVLD